MPDYCNLYCGDNKDTIISKLNETHTGYINIVGAGSSHSITEEFIENLIYACDYIHMDLVGINIGEDIFEISDRAFQSIESDTPITITFDEGFERIGRYAFAYSDIITSITFPKSIKIIDRGAFLECQNLQSIIFTVDEETGLSNIDTIEMSAFQNDYSLGSITTTQTESGNEFPNGLKYIYPYAFERCQGFTSSNSITFPDSVINIGAYAFAWTTFGEITLGKGLSTLTKRIPEGATLEPPQKITLCSKRQFRYFHASISGPTNVIQLPEEFITCVNEDQFMVFLNGRYVPHGSVFSHPVDNTPLYKYEIYLDIPDVDNGDEIDIFYIPEILTSLNDNAVNLGSFMPYIPGTTDLYDDLLPYNYLPKEEKGFIVLNSPMYGNSNKESLFIFINGRKVDIDSIYNISDTMFRITKYLQDETTERFPVQIMSFMDNVDINTMIFSKDGLSHSTDLINIVNLESLESYKNLSTLDKMLYNLPREKLEILFPVETHTLVEGRFVGIRHNRDSLVRNLYNINKSSGDNDWYTNI